jgi:glyoxylase-like metal-dependent hydrolase (beta-lactamase superfamily II)/rhodanese-related sulfurtransferase
MKVEQLYTGCLAEAAYYIESEGQAAIIDPMRETEPYIKKFNKEGVVLKYIFETHFHADFVSGHIDLSKKTGAQIIYGPNAHTEFASYSAKDNEEFRLGKLTIKVIYTPGHTLESSCFLLYDENKKPYSLFTGDTLFIGDVGRPDLAIKSDLTEDDLAGMLYDSLHTKILSLDDELIVYPGHGAGSACGKSMSKETWDKLGNQKKVNYALQPMNKQEFIKKVTEDLLPPPQYFPLNAKMNKTGYQSLDTIMDRGLTKLNPPEFEKMAISNHALILDTRDPEQFSLGYIPGSINIGLNGQFAPWIGALITDIKKPILIIAEEGKEEEVITRLSRVGYDHSIGYLSGGIEAWKKAGKPVETIESISPVEFEKRWNSKQISILDVRREAEFDGGHVKNAQNLPLDFINDWISQLDRNKDYYVHCAGGYRSMIAASILRSRGFNEIINVSGGFNAISSSTNLCQLT